MTLDTTFTNCEELVAECMDIVRNGTYAGVTLDDLQPSQGQAWRRIVRMAVQIAGEYGEWPSQ
jgi:hypothetical protein